MDCVFCKIINKELPSEIIFEDEKFIVFNDINPKAPVHLLIVPKEHIISAADLEETPHQSKHGAWQEDKELAGELILTAKNIAKEKNLGGYKLVINVGREGGQIVDHLHLHLLSGKIATLP